MGFPKAIMFDMDGLIFDTEKVYKESWLAAAEKLGFKITENLWNSMIGVRVEECENKLTDEFGAEFPLEKFGEMWRQAFNETVDASGMEYKPGFTEFFDYLISKGYYVGLTTSSYEEDVKRNFAGKREIDLFSLILTGDKIKESKPSPETYIRASEISCIEPGEIIVFEDSINGMYSAINAGCRAVMVPDIQEPDEYIKKYSFMILCSLDEAIESIFKKEGCF